MEPKLEKRQAFNLFLVSLIVIIFAVTFFAIAGHASLGGLTGNAVLNAAKENSSQNSSISENQSQPSNATVQSNSTPNASQQSNTHSQGGGSGGAGATKNILLDPLIKNANGLSLAAQIVVKYKNGSVVTTFQTGGTQTISPGYYDVEVLPQSGPVKAIDAQNVNLSSDLTSIVDIDTPPSHPGYVQLYALNPKLGTNLTVTATATGDALYKCKSWNFSARTCPGSWTKMFDITPGYDYSFSIGPNDPAFAEINITDAQHLDENRTFIDDVYNQTVAQDNIWTEPIYANQYIRATFEQNLTNGSVINLYVRNNQSLNTSLNIYEENGSTILGSTPIITSTGMYDVTLSGMSGTDNTFDIQVANQENDTTAYFEFDYIHDSPPTFATYNLFNSTDAVYTAYKQMLNQSLPAGAYSTDTLSVAATGTFCYPENWTTTNFSTQTLFNGTWNFSVYKVCNTNAATVTMYGGLFKLNGTAPGTQFGIVNTTNSSEVCTASNVFQSVNWSFTVPYSSLVNLTPGERIGAQICVNVTKSSTGKAVTLYWGNTTAPSNINFPTQSFDTTPPSVFDLHPVNGSVFNTSNTITISANVTDNVAVDTVLANVTLSNGTVQQLTLVLDGGSKYNNTFIAPNLTGLYNVTFIANDTSNNVNSTQKTNFTVNDITPPAVQFVSPTETNGTYLSRTYIQMNATASDNVALKNITISLYNSTGLFNSSTTTTSPDFFNQTGLANGLYKFNATAYDTSSNKNTTETRTVTLDTINPAISYVSPTESAGALLNRTYVQINVTASDTNFANVTVNLYNSIGGIVNSTTKTTSPNFINQTGLADGFYYFNATALDLAGNSNTTATRNVTIDTTPPVVFDLRPIAGSNYGASQLIEIAANVTDATTSVSSVLANVTLSNGTIQQLSLSLATGNKYNTSFTIPNLTGAYTVRFIANDSLNNVNSTQTTTFNVFDTTPPAISSTTASPSKVNASANVTINATVTDNIAVDKVWLTIWNGAVALLTKFLSLVSGNLYSTTITTNSSFAANTTYTIYANDTSGNNATPLNGSFLVNRAPSVTLNSPANNTQINNTETVAFNFTSTDDLSTTYTCSLYIDGAVSATDFSFANGTNDVFVKSIAYGSHNWYANCTDTDGLYNTSVTYLFAINDTIPPAVQFVSPTETSGAYLSRTYAQINVTASDNVAVQNITIYLYNSTGGLYNSTTMSTSPNFLNQTGLADGVYYFNATAYDTSGNKNTTETRNITVDTINPTISYASPTEADGSFLNRTYLQVNVTASDTNLANITIYIYNSTGLYNSSTTASSPNFLNQTGLADGIYYFNATALDLAGNSNSTATRSVTIDTAAPTISSTTATPSPVNIGQNVTINATVTDNINVSSVWVTVWNGAFAILTKFLSFISGNLYSTQVTTNESFATNTTYTIYSNDTTGNLATPLNGSFLVNRAPGITLNSPVNNVQINNTQTLSFNFTAVDDLNTTLNCGIYLDSTLNQTNSSTQNNTATVFTIDGISYGAHSWLVNCSDGTLSNVSSTNSFTINDTIPPAVQFVSPTETAGSQVNRPYIQINVTASDNVALQNITIYLFNSGGSLITSTTTSTSPNFVNYTNLASGMYYFNATAYDWTGNSNTTETRNVTITILPPAVFDVRPVAGIVYNTTSTIEVAANVTSVLAISSVVANVTFPNGTLQRLTLSLAAGDKYNASFLAPEIIGQYNVTFVANDTSNNINSTQTTNFNITTTTNAVIETENTTYAQGTSQTPSQNPSFGYKQYINFQTNYYDTLTGNEITNGNCNVVANNSGSTVSLAYNSTTGNYTGSLDTDLEFDNTTFTASCTSPSMPSASGSTTANIYWFTYIIGTGNIFFGGSSNNLSNETTWLSKVTPTSPNALSRTFNVTLSPNATGIDVGELFFCGSNPIQNCSFLKNLNLAGTLNMRANVSASANNTCKLSLCYSIDTSDLQNIYSQCDGHTTLSTTPTIVEENLTLNGTSVVQGDFLDYFAKCDADPGLTNTTQVNITLYYNYSGEPANLQISHPMPVNNIIANDLLHQQLISQPVLGPNQALDMPALEIINFNNTANFSQLYEVFHTPDEEFSQFAPSIVPNTIYVYNSTGQLWASDNASAGAPYTAMLSSNDVINYATETIAANTAVNETLNRTFGNSLRDNESLASNSSTSKYWNANVTTIFTDEEPIDNVTVYTNYSLYGVPDTFTFNVNLTNSSGTFDVTSSTVQNTSAKTLTMQEVRLCSCEIGTCTNCPGFAKFSISAKDLSPPVVASVAAMPSAINQSQTTNITANVTDDVAVDTVLANITYPNGTTVTQQMSLGAGSTYSTLFTPTASYPIGTYTVAIVANDTANNVNSTETTSFTVNDITPPAVFDLKPVSGSVFSIFSTVEIAANVTDSTAVDSVLANITLPNSTVQQLVLSLTAGSKYNASFNASNATGQYNVTFIANDTSNNVNSTETTHFSVIVAPPSVTLLSPDNGAVDGNGDVAFNCSASTTVGLENISLYFDGLLNQTNAAGGNSNQTSFNLNGLANGNYNWSCSAYDTLGGFNQSETRNFTVNAAAVPVYNNFTGNTTNWSAVPDLQNVCNGTAVLDVPPTGQIVWNNCVNATYQNFDTNVLIAQNNVTVNFGLNPTFNSSATVTIRNLTWDAPPLIFADGVLCLPPTCSDITYNATTGVVVFNVTHFTSYTSGPDSQMTIWDETDAGMPFAGQTKYKTQQVNFFANYTNVTSGAPITGATCYINFTDTSGTMAYNSTNQVYQFNRSFAANGTFAWNATCTATNYNTLMTNDTVLISPDTTPPTISLIAPTPANNSYLSAASLTVNASVNNNVAVDSCTLDLNGTNSSMTVVGSGSSATCNETVSGLSDGVYKYKVYANDTSNNLNVSETRTVTIDTINPSVQFVSPTAASGTATKKNYTQINVTASDTNFANVTIYLYNATGLVNSTTKSSSPIFLNQTGLANGIYYFNATALDLAGNSNTTETRNVTIDTIPPALSVQSPANGTTFAALNLSLNYTVSDDVAVDSCWFTNPNGTRMNLMGCQNTTFLANNGNNNITVYANDTAGNTNSSQVFFTVDTTKPAVNFVSPTPANNASINVDYAYINVTAVNALTAIDTCLLNFNGTQYTMNKVGSGLSVKCNYNVTSLVAGTYYYNATANDSVGNIGNTSTRNLTIDFTPPATITNLNNISVSYNSITWNWTNPSDADFSHVIVYINGVFKANVSGNSYQATGLSGSTNYTISTETADNAGNINTTFVNSTARTTATPPTPPPSNVGAATGGVTTTPSARFDGIIYIGNETSVEVLRTCIPLNHTIHFYAKTNKISAAVNSFTNDSAMLSLNGTDYTIGFNGTTSVDTDNNGMNDLNVTFYQVKDVRACFIFTAIAEVPKVVPIVPAPVENITTNITPQQPTLIPQANLIPMWVFIVLVLAGIALVAEIGYEYSRYTRALEIKGGVVRLRKTSFARFKSSLKKLPRLIAIKLAHFFEYLGKLGRKEKRFINRSMIFARNKLKGSRSPEISEGGTMPSQKKTVVKDHQIFERKAVGKSTSPEIQEGGQEYDKEIKGGFFESVALAGKAAAAYERELFTKKLPKLVRKTDRYVSKEAEQAKQVVQGSIQEAAPAVKLAGGQIKEGAMVAGAFVSKEARRAEHKIQKDIKKATPVIKFAGGYIGGGINEAGRFLSKEASGAERFAEREIKKSLPVIKSSGQRIEDGVQRAGKFVSKEAQQAEQLASRTGKALSREVKQAERFVKAQGKFFSKGSKAREAASSHPEQSAEQQTGTTERMQKEKRAEGLASKIRNFFLTETEQAEQAMKTSGELLSNEAQRAQQMAGRAEGRLSRELGRAERAAGKSRRFLSKEARRAEQRLRKSGKFISQETEQIAGRAGDFLSKEASGAERLGRRAEAFASKESGRAKQLTKKSGRLLSKEAERAAKLARKSGEFLSKESRYAEDFAEKELEKSLPRIKSAAHGLEESVSNAGRYMSREASRAERALQKEIKNSVPAIKQAGKQMRESIKGTSRLLSMETGRAERTVEKEIKKSLPKIKQAARQLEEKIINQRVWQPKLPEKPHGVKLNPEEEKAHHHKKKKILSELKEVFKL